MFRYLLEPHSFEETCLFLAGEFRLEFSDFVFVLLNAHHVPVAEILHRGKRQVSPRLKLGEGDSVLGAEFFSSSMPMPSDFATRLNLLGADLLAGPFPRR